MGKRIRKTQSRFAKQIAADKVERQARRKEARKRAQENGESPTAFAKYEVDPDVEAKANEIISEFGGKFKDLHTWSLESLERLHFALITKGYRKKRPFRFYTTPELRRIADLIRSARHLGDENGTVESST